MLAGSMKLYSICLSVCLSHQSAAAVGLLLWAQQSGYIDQLLHSRRSAAKCEQCHAVS